ncbi:MAG: phytanoyl-CoA dioxygenase family protein [Chloroflexi bacterium]|nr:phytanoyl-CoA dioxygenase family protein [Chloroflexota bacterium]MCY3938688.1 phytanoyl-CoA dioxygenase family protein [Chloroflexota bacterium]
MALSTGQVQQFRELGFLAVPEFFSDREVKALQAEVERLNRDGIFRNVATEGDGRTESRSRQNLQIVPLHPHSDLVKALPFHPKVIEHVTDLIGDRIVVHLDQVFLKPARTGLGTGWHQDNAYFRVKDPLKGTAMWIAVHEANAANGTLRVLPNMMDKKIAHERDPYSDHHVRIYPEEKKAVSMELPAGGVAFFCYGTPHATGDNTTNEDRAGLAFHFLHEDHVNDSLRINPYGPILTGPRAAGGEEEYGARVDGLWDGQVEKLLATVD